MEQLIELQELSIALKSGVELVHGIDLTIHPGEILGLVGESGSGKSLTGKAMARLNDEHRFEYGGRIQFKGQNILDLKSGKLRQYHRHEVSMIFQDPMNSLNPLSTIRKQLFESIRLVKSMNRSAMEAHARDLLIKSGFADHQVENVLASYPHELSGGMQQRIMIALAIAKQPALLIADEPTTALDVTIQANIIELLQTLNQTGDLSILFITHDLSVAQKLCHRIAVMRQGEIVELAPTAELFSNPVNSYTLRLFESIPGLTETQQDNLQQMKQYSITLKEQQRAAGLVEIEPGHYARLS